MHHNTKLISAALVAPFFLMMGCSTPKHTDLLVFGTNTEFGASITGSATANGGLSIGYHRQEVVLMPLYVNATESTLGKPAATSVADAKYQGADSEVRKDTYSVLASFGANGSASNGDGTKVTIAQYFATGLAARTLAMAGGALVTTGTTGASQTISAAAIKADKAINDEAADAIKILNQRVDDIMSQVTDTSDPAKPKIDKAKLTKIADGVSGVDADWVELYSNKPPDALRSNLLARKINSVPALHGNLTKLTQ
jgi:hypothetical protein